MASPSPARADLIPRRVPRHPVAVPVDLTVLRSGVPDCIPGRSVDVGEGGLAAIVAGELRLGDSVGVEMRLPHANQPLMAKAVVRHQARLRCGLEFVGLSVEQRAVIRHWTQGENELKAEMASWSLPQASTTENLERVVTHPPNRSSSLRILWMALAIFGLVGALGWWQWYRVWDELDSRLPVRPVNGESVMAKVPATEMEHLLTHKVDPVYPESAKQTGAQGMVILDAVIGPDGKVRNLHPVSGPDVLETAALDAVRWWRFEPYRVNGKAVEVETTVAVEFQKEEP
jgi:TonB family protein